MRVEITDGEVDIESQNADDEEFLHQIEKRDKMNRLKNIVREKIPEGEYTNDEFVSKLYEIVSLDEYNPEEYEY